MTLRSRQTGVGVVLLLVFVVGMSIWGPGVTVAQNAAVCAQILSDVQKQLSEGCAALDKNEICYGNKTITVEFQGGDSPTFGKAGDIAPLSAVKSLKSGPLNPERGEWGLAVLKVQAANLPNTTAGQTATFIVYGDTSFTNLTQPPAPGSDNTAPEEKPAAGPSCPATTTRSTYLRARPGPNEQTVELLQSNTQVTISERRADGQWVFTESQGRTGWLYIQNLKLDCDVNTLPVNDPNAVSTLPGLNSFYFSTAVGAQSSCTDIPPAGLFVQSPGGRKITFKANGADITVGSSVILSAQPNGGMILSVIQGQALINVSGFQQTVNEGQQTTITLGGGPEGLDALGLPGGPRPITRDIAGGLFVSTLCKAGNAAGLGVPCQIQQPTATPRPQQPTSQQPLAPTATFVERCDQRTFRPDGYVCMPGIGPVPCNRDGICNNGEHSYICPEDCGAPPPTKPPCAGTQPC